MAAMDDVNMLVRQLQRQPAVQGLLARSLDGRARIDGVASLVDLAQDTTAILAAHPSGHVPLSSVHFFNDVHLDARNVAVIHDAIEVAMVPEGSYRLELSHLALHHGAGLTHFPSTARPSGSFGTLVVFYASTATGGDITASLDGASVHCPSPQVVFFAFNNACDVVVAPITSGARAMLVFDLVYRNANYEAPSVASLLTALQVAATKKRQKTTLRAHEFLRQDEPLDLETLAASDKQFMERLVRTDCWDIALVLSEPRQRAPANRVIETESSGAEDNMHLLQAHDDEADGNEEARDDDEDDDQSVDRIIAYIMHPSNALPPVFTHALDNKPLLSYVHDTYVPMRKGCLVFWSKQHRLRLLGFRASLRQLDALVTGASTDLYGYASMLMFADAVLGMVDSDVARLSDNTDVPDVTRLGRVLLALGDVPLLQEFVAAINVREVDAHLQALLVTMLRHFGWPTFDASIQTLLQRVPLDLLDVRCGAGLVAACLPLTQPYMREFILAAYHALLQQLCTFETSFDTSVAATPLLRDMLLIEAHLNRTLDDDHESMYLGVRLPHGVVHHISSFLCPGALADIVCHRLPPWQFDPIRVIAPSIRALRIASLPLDPYRVVIDDAVKRVLQIPDRHDETSEGWAAVLALQLEAATVDDDLLTRFFATCRPAIGIETIHDLAAQCLNVVPLAVRTSLARYLVQAVTALVTDNDNDMVASVTKAWSALEAFELTDVGPPIVAAVHQRWTALATDAEKVAFASRIMHTWHPVVVMTRRPRLLRPLLASILQVLERYVRTHERPTPDTHAWALPSIYFACDCEQCTAAQSFVADATRGIFSLPSSHLCMHFLARIEHPFPNLKVREDDEDAIELCKAGANKLRHYERLCSYVDSIRTALQDDDQEPFSKRQRRDDVSTA